MRHLNHSKAISLAKRVGHMAQAALRRAERSIRLAKATLWQRRAARAIQLALVAIRKVERALQKALSNLQVEEGYRTSTQIPVLKPIAERNRGANKPKQNPGKAIRAHTAARPQPAARHVAEPGIPPAPRQGWGSRFQDWLFRSYGDQWKWAERLDKYVRDKKRGRPLERA